MSWRASKSMLPVVALTIASSAIETVVWLTTTLMPTEPATAVVFEPSSSWLEPPPASASTLKSLAFASGVPAVIASEPVVVVPSPNVARVVTTPTFSATAAPTVVSPPPVPPPVPPPPVPPPVSSSLSPPLANASPIACVSASASLSASIFIAPSASIVRPSATSATTSGVMIVTPMEPATRTMPPSVLCVAPPVLALSPFGLSSVAPGFDVCFAASSFASATVSSTLGSSTVVPDLSPACLVLSDVSLSAVLPPSSSSAPPMALPNTSFFACTSETALTSTLAAVAAPVETLRSSAARVSSSMTPRPNAMPTPVSAPSVVASDFVFCVLELLADSTRLPSTSSARPGSTITSVSLSAIDRAIEPPTAVPPSAAPAPALASVSIVCLPCAASSTLLAPLSVAVSVKIAEASCWPMLSANDTPTPTLLRSEEHTSELQSQSNLVCRLLLEKKKKKKKKKKYKKT